MIKFLRCLFLGHDLDLSDKAVINIVETHVNGTKSITKKLVLCKKCNKYKTIRVYMVNINQGEKK